MSRTARAAFIAAFAWAAALAGAFALHHPLGPVNVFPHGAGSFEWVTFGAAWGGHFARASMVAVWLFALFAWGSPSGKWLSASLSRSPLFGHAALGLGFGALGAAIIGLGLTGLLFPAPLAAAAAVPPLVFRAWRLLAPAGRMLAGMLSDWRRNWGFKLALAVPVALALPGMLSPEGGWDAMVYHLGLPSFYLMEHKLFMPIRSPFAGYPALTEMHYMLAMALTGLDHVPKLMHAACWLATAALIHRAVRFAGPAAAFGSVLVWLLSPLAIQLSGTAYVDHATAWMGALCAAFAAGAWSESRGSPPGCSAAGFEAGTGSRLLVPAGVFAGLAFLTKYTGAFVGAGFLAAAFLFSSGRRRGVEPFIAAVAAAVVALVWPVRNWLAAGNPVYPFFAGILGGAGSPAVDFWGANPPGHSAGAVEFLLRPWRAAVVDDGGVGASLSPLFLAVLLPALVAGRFDRKRLAFLAAGGIAWWMMPLDSRFLIALIPAAVMAAAPAWRARPVMVAAFAATALLAPLCLREAARASFGQFDVLPPFLGLRSYEKHLSYGLPPQPEYLEAARAINRRLAPRSRLLLVAGIKSYYIDRRAAVSHWEIDPVPVLYELRRAPSARRLAVRLRQEGFSHLVYMPRAMTVVAGIPGAAMSDAEAGLYVEWLRGWTRFEFRVREVLVYSLGVASAPRPLGRVPLLEERAMREATGEGEGGAIARLKRLAPESSSLAAARAIGFLVRSPAAPGAALAVLDGISGDPEASAVAWRAKGYSLYRQGAASRSLACFRRAIELNPADAETRYNAGALLQAMGRLREAHEELAMAASLDPGQPRYRRALAELSRLGAGSAMLR